MNDIEKNGRLQTFTTLAERSGSGVGDMTIQWDWDQWTDEQPIRISGLEGTGTTYDYTWSAEGVNFDRYGKGRQTLTLHNISKNLTLYVTIQNGGYRGTADNLIYQPSFAGLPNRSAGVMKKALRSAAAAVRQNDAPRAGADSGSVMTAEVLQAYLNSLNETASCKEGENHIYKEYVGEYPITGDSWSLNIPELPKFNEYGKEYKYYVVEESPTSGYQVTYAGQNGGLQADGSVTINNKKMPPIDLQIIKIDETTRESTPQTRLPEAEFKLLKYTVPEGSDTGNYTNFPDAASCEKMTGEDGTLMFTGLTDGQYRIDETVEPKGYVKQEEVKIYFTVASGAVTWTNQAGETITAQNLVSYSPDDKAFTVGNIPGAALPSTGGPGTSALTILGAILTAGAGLLLWKRREIL